MQVTRVALALLAAGQSLALTTPNLNRRSPEPEFVDGKFLVDRASFANHASYTFTGSSLPAGLYASNYGVGDTHTFTPNNVIIRDGYLQLLVNGGQTAKPYKSAQIETTVTNIKYASVRTVAILTEPAGVCNGMFFYKSDTQESDIEWLSDPASQSNQGTRKLWLTNQDANGDGHSTYFDPAPPSNPTTTEHEYRLDWTEGLVQWFVDGVQVAQTTQDVPSQAGPWLWNNWSNGDKGWSAGPPSQDAVFKVKSIDMYYNTA
ncbi:concanavalin A-like lectin/glucanase domain-containing protein [Thelonectria olida]|uniref:Concanavalin A-like lectin/glucanase domain-containing protein n=1 Tax=Thelonectria olida TaxID=1576542 RepID=A0A9P9ANJ7_9HYPO|nr:concanavalin A-like lectin/glucanase domain-containing protein [Thelonectria olida]